MKKLILSFLTVLSCGTVCALPIGNPASPKLYTSSLWFGDNEWSDPCDPCTSWFDWIDLRMGYYGNFVYNRRLEVDSSEGPTISNTTITTNDGLFTFSFCRWIDLFAHVGVSNFEASSPLSAANPIETTLYYSPSLSYGGGGKITFWSCDDFFLGVEGQYFYSNTELDSLQLDSTGVLTYFNSDSERDAGYGEWQVSVACSYRFVDSANFSMVPYAALVFSGVSWKTEGTGDSNIVNLSDLKEQQVTGWALGATALLCDMVGISVEGHWANQKALSIIGQISF